MSVSSTGKVVESNGSQTVVRRGQNAVIAGEQRISADTATIEGLENTHRSRKLFLLGKVSPGAKTVYHLDTDITGFIVHTADGAEVTPEPSVSLSVAQGYKANLDGTLVLDGDGEPILGPLVEFDTLPVNGVYIDGERDSRLMGLKAPDSTVPYYLVGQGKKFSFQQTTDIGVIVQAVQNPNEDLYLACDGSTITDLAKYALLYGKMGSAELPTIADVDQGAVTIKSFIRAL